MATTGSLMIMACLAYWAITLNDPVLQIHFPDQTLRPTFTPAYWLTLVTGIATLFTACGILTLELVIPRKVATFFNYDTIPDDSIFEVNMMNFMRVLNHAIMAKISIANVSDCCRPIAYFYNLQG